VSARTASLLSAMTSGVEQTADDAGRRGSRSRWTRVMQYYRYCDEFTVHYFARADCTDWTIPLSVTWIDGCTESLPWWGGVLCVSGGWWYVPADTQLLKSACYFIINRFIKALASVSLPFLVCAKTAIVFVLVCLWTGLLHCSWIFMKFLGVVGLGRRNDQVCCTVNQFWHTFLYKFFIVNVINVKIWWRL